MIKNFVIILAVLSIFTVSGCKGKEQKQSPESISTAQTEGVIQKQQETLDSEKTNVPYENSKESTGITAPKIISLDISPRIPVIGDTIKAAVKTNLKEEDITIHYQWSINDGDIMAEETDSLMISPDKFKRGDKIKLRVIPDDGTLKGTPMTVVITVGNAAPIIKSSKDTIKFDGNTYTYQIRAYDPDGDSLNYSLVTAPKGMRIDQSGFVQWTVPDNFRGPASFTISVSDGHGGETLQSFNLDIR